MVFKTHYKILCIKKFSIIQNGSYNFIHFFTTISKKISPWLISIAHFKEIYDEDFLSKIVVAKYIKYVRLLEPLLCIIHQVHG